MFSVSTFNFTFAFVIYLVFESCSSTEESCCVTIFGVKVKTLRWSLKLTFLILHHERSDTGETLFEKLFKRFQYLIEEASVRSCLCYVNSEILKNSGFLEHSKNLSEFSKENKSWMIKYTQKVSFFLTKQSLYSLYTDVFFE